VQYALEQYGRRLVSDCFESFGPRLRKRRRGPVIVIGARSAPTAVKSSAVYRKDFSASFFPQPPDEVSTAHISLTTQEHSRGAASTRWSTSEPWGPDALRVRSALIGLTRGHRA